MFEIIRSLLKRVPGLVRLVQNVRTLRRRLRTTTQIFEDIALKNLWGGRESVSGPGSDVAKTETLRRELPDLLKELQVSSLLDLPCGDFHWMKLMDLEGVDYLGADIVPHLIDKLKKYENDSRRFMRLDIIRDELPRADIVLVRDCFIHFSYKHIFRALRNLRKSGSIYLLTSTFPIRSTNIDIVTGDWRTINLEISPFNFPEPIRIIRENNPSRNDAGKSLGLWKLSDILV